MKKRLKCFLKTVGMGLAVAAVTVGAIAIIGVVTSPSSVASWFETPAYQSSPPPILQFVGLGILVVSLASLWWMCGIEETSK